MKTKHTPGPWEVKGTNPPMIYAREGLDIIAMIDSMGEVTLEQEAANARLIAAAPKLLAALRLVAIDYAGETPTGSDPRSRAIRAASAAIAEATGE
jgi:hypothetical protein